MLSIKTYDQFPNLALWVNEYFSFDNGDIKGKNIGGFIEAIISDGRITKNQTNDAFHAALGICETLCRSGLMFCIHKGEGVGSNNSYLTNALTSNRSLLEIELNSAVYGFEYIYRYYEKLVVPILHTSHNGDQQLGTGFIVPGGIATALHCLQNAKEISIKGFSGACLQRCSVLISPTPDIDIAYITGAIETARFARIENGEPAQEVLAMGYPKIPTFDVFLTAERALISAIPTKGAITAFGKSIFTKQNMMLITAKIKGGNSGGPIINSRGHVVGIACEILIICAN